MLDVNDILCIRCTVRCLTEAAPLSNLRGSKVHIRILTTVWQDSERPRPRTQAITSALRCDYTYIWSFQVKRFVATLCVPYWQFAPLLLSLPVSLAAHRRTHCNRYTHTDNTAYYTALKGLFVVP